MATRSAAQVGVLKGELVFTEKSNAIESVRLSGDGAVAGNAALVAAIPANVDAPFGLATRGDDAYVTIAHADEISLVRHDTVLAVDAVGHAARAVLGRAGRPVPVLGQLAQPVACRATPCTARRSCRTRRSSRSSSATRPTSTYRDGFAAVVDAAGGASRVSIFKVDQDGNFALQGVAALPARPPTAWPSSTRTPGVEGLCAGGRRPRRVPAYHRRSARTPRARA